MQKIQFEEIYNKYLNLIRFKANKYCRIVGFFYIDDFIQAGLLGMWKCYLWFDPDKVINKSHDLEYNLMLYCNNEMKILYNKIKNIMKNNSYYLLNNVGNTDIQLDIIDSNIINIINEVLSGCSDITHDIFDLWLINKMIGNTIFWDSIIKYIYTKYQILINKTSIYNRLYKVKLKLKKKLERYYKNC